MPIKLKNPFFPFFSIFFFFFFKPKDKDRRNVRETLLYEFKLGKHSEEKLAERENLAG